MAQPHRRLYAGVERVPASLTVVRSAFFGQIEPFAVRPETAIGGTSSADSRQRGQTPIDGAALASWRRDRQAPRQYRFAVLAYEET